MATLVTFSIEISVLLTFDQRSRRVETKMSLIVRRTIRPQVVCVTLKFLFNNDCIFRE